MLIIWYFFVTFYIFVYFFRENSCLVCCPYCRQPITVVMPLYITSFEDDDDNSDLDSDSHDEDQPEELFYLIPCKLYYNRNLNRWIVPRLVQIVCQIQTSQQMDRRHLDRRHLDRQYSGPRSRRYLSFRHRRLNHIHPSLDPSLHRHRRSNLGPNRQPN